MTTFSTNSLDGTPLIYERCGTGPALILLHGGGGSRREWHEAGYVGRLQEEFTVITPDLRGHGESGAPSDPADYTVDKMIQDILAVADACGIDHFTLWGMSHGGKIGRYLATRSERVDKFVLMSAPLGPGASNQLCREIADFTAHWAPLLQAQRAGTLDLASLSQDDQEFLQTFKVPAMMGWGPAMLDWPPVEPADFRCPVLWLAGAQDAGVMESVREYEAALAGSNIQLQVIAEFNHGQVFDEIDAVFPGLLAFTRGRTDR